MEVTFTNTKEELLRANLIVWSDVAKVLKLKSVFYCLHRNIVAHLIPKRAFSQNPDQYELLKKMIINKVRSSKKLKLKAH